MYISKGGMRMEKPILRLFKKAEKTMNKVILPKAFIDKHGHDFYMEIYNDKIVLKPIKKGE